VQGEIITFTSIPCFFRSQNPFQTLEGPADAVVTNKRIQLRTKSYDINFWRKEISKIPVKQPMIQVLALKRAVLNHRMEDISYEKEDKDDKSTNLLKITFITSFYNIQTEMKIYHPKARKIFTSFSTNK
jgi:hypothetical protein